MGSIQQLSHSVTTNFNRLFWVWNNRFLTTLQKSQCIIFFKQCIKLTNRFYHFFLFKLKSGYINLVPTSACLSTSRNTSAKWSALRHYCTIYIYQKFLRISERFSAYWILTRVHYVKLRTTSIAGSLTCSNKTKASLY